MKSLSKREMRRIITIAACVLGLIIVGIIVHASGQGGVPQEFLAARISASAISKSIVQLTSDTNKTIKAVNINDEEGNFQQARVLVAQARTANNAANQKAYQLSSELQHLAESLKNISGREGQQIAYEAVATELSLVSEFIAYTGNLSAFLDTVDQAIQTHSQKDRKAMERALAEVNRNVANINSLNSSFLSKMAEFDTSVQ